MFLLTQIPPITEDLMRVTYLTCLLNLSEGIVMALRLVQSLNLQSISLLIIPVNIRSEYVINVHFYFPG